MNTIHNRQPFRADKQQQLNDELFEKSNPDPGSFLNESVNMLMWELFMINEVRSIKCAVQKC